jgi:hypothetical protein
MARSRGLAGTAAVLLLTGALGGGVAGAQAGHTAAPDTFGQSSVTHTFNAYAFEPTEPTSSAALSWDTNYRRTCTASCGITASVMLPNGALIDSIVVEGCDTSASSNLGVLLFYYPFDSDGVVLPPGGNLQTTGTPGCDFFTTDLTPPLAVDNSDATYYLEAALSPSVRLRSVRIRYRLQVSPAPGVATFPVDVPTTHPFFRFIEALAAAGITAGCDPGMYCPDQPVTRGQMAVFLSVALGLHFPN